MRNVLNPSSATADAGPVWCTTPGRPAAADAPHHAAGSSAEVVELAVETLDGELAGRVLAGDRDAFEQIVQRHERAVFYHLRRLMRQQEDAEDVTQETFLTAFRKLALYRRDLPLRPWLLRIATHLAYSRLRRKRPMTTSLDLKQETLQLPDPAAMRLTERLDAAGALGRLEQALEALPPELATLFSLRYREELSVESIAQVFNKKPGSIAVALHRLREKLRKIVFVENGKEERR